MRRYRAVFILAAISVALGLAFGLFIVAVAVSHNPQQQFYDPASGIKIAEVTPLFLVSLAEAGLISFCLGLAAYVGFRCLRRRVPN